MSDRQGWRSIEIYWEDGTRTTFFREEMDKLARASNMLRELQSAVRIAEELLSLTREIRK